MEIINRFVAEGIRILFFGPLVHVGTSHFRVYDENVLVSATCTVERKRVLKIKYELTPTQIGAIRRLGVSCGG